MVLIGAGLPNQLASGGIDGIEVSDDVAEIGGGGAIWPAFAKRNAGADFSACGISPADTAGFQVKGIDSAILAADENSSHGDGRLRSSAGGGGEAEAPLQLKISNLRPVEASGLRRHVAAGIVAPACQLTFVERGENIC